MTISSIISSHSKLKLLLVLLLGFSLRVTGADSGFPFLINSIEDVVAPIPLSMAERNSFDPDEYNHPDHFDIYANAILYNASSRLIYQKPLTETFENHRLFYYHLSRIFVAIMSTACIMIAYLIGNEYNKNTGVIAALLVAVFPSYIEHSHIIAADTPLTLFTLTVILFSIKYLKRPSHTNLLVASFFSAITLSVKYPGGMTILLVVAVLLCIHHKNRKLLSIKLIEMISAFVFFLFLVSPYLFINYSRVIKAILINANPIHLGADNLGWMGNIIFYATSYLGYSGVLMMIFFFLGCFYIIKQERLLSLPIFFGLFYWLVLSAVGLHWERWALPMYICPLLVSAYGMNVTYCHALQQHNKYFFRLWLLAFIIIFSNLLVSSAVTTAKFTLKNTLYASFLFTQEVGIKEKNTLYEGYTPFQPAGNGRFFSVRKAYYLLDKYKNIQYIIISSALYDRYLKEKKRYKEDIEFYDKIFSLPLVKKFAPKEYFSDVSTPFYLNNDLSRGIAFLIDFAVNRQELLAGPTINIYKYDSPGFLDY